jgi:Fic family protein
MNISVRQQQIIAALLTGASSQAQLSAHSAFQEVTERTLQRDLGELAEWGVIERIGEARATNYSVTNRGRLGIRLSEGALERVFSDENRPRVQYNFERLHELQLSNLFSESEFVQLTHLHELFHHKMKSAPADIIRRERERITIELSWKSSQFEGNTYTLLETETLIKEGLEAKGKTKDETQMILNHKKALDFSAEHPELFRDSLTVNTILALHRELAEGLFCLLYTSDAADDM